MTDSSTYDDPGELARLGPGDASLVTDCDWLIAQLEGLYAFDDRGRITTRRDAGLASAPRFHLGRTRHGNLWRIRADVPGPLAGRLSRLAAREPGLSSRDAPWPLPERAAALSGALDASVPVESQWAGCVFRLPTGPEALRAIEARAEASEPLDLGDPASRRALEEQRPHVVHGVERQPIVTSCEAGRIASVCHAAAGHGGQALEAGVDTAPAWRQRGHGARAVAGWMIAVRRIGRTPLYSARHDDRASLAVARSLGLEPFADTLHWT